MFKKIAMAAAVAATASFASWDLYPVLPKHQGEAKLSVYHSKFTATRTSEFITYCYTDIGYCNTEIAREYGRGNSTSAALSARFTVIQNLELSLSIPYHFYTEFQGTDIGETYDLGSISLGARYQFLPYLNVFFDAVAPTDDLSTNLIDGVWLFTGGMQFSKAFNSTVNFGSELAFDLATRAEREHSYLGLTAAVEADFTILPNFTPYLGARLDAHMGTFDSKDGYVYTAHGGKFGTWITAGANVALSKRLGLNASYGFGIGDHIYGEESSTYTAELSFKF